MSLRGLFEYRSNGLATTHAVFNASFAQVGIIHRFVKGVEIRYNHFLSFKYTQSVFPAITDSWSCLLNSHYPV